MSVPHRGVESSAEELPVIVDRMRPRLKAIFCRYRLTPEDAEDVLQTAMLRALVRWDEIRDKERWLYGTVCRMSCGCWRSAWKRDVVSMDPQDLEWLGGCADPPQERCDRMADVERACRQLSRRQGRVLVLRHAHGLRVAEVAAAVGIQPVSVRKVAHRALAQVRETLGICHAPRPGALGGRLGATPAALFAVLFPVLPLLSAHAKRCLDHELAAAAPALGRPPSPVHGDAQGPVPCQPGEGVSWHAAVSSFLACYCAVTRPSYRREITRAGEAMGFPALAALDAEALRRWRASLLEDGRPLGAHTFGLSALRSFLLWTGEQGAHELPPEVIRAALAHVRPAPQG
jgi:RNA polymerase sigma factor (sigma-70 family)